MLKNYTDSSPVYALLDNSVICIFIIKYSGVSLQLLGQTIPNNSLVDFDDLAYQAPNSEFAEAPTNANGRQTLMCVTDLVACCETEGLGNWYFPDGNVITSDRLGGTFRANRGDNEVINGQQFYGSVRLWRRYTPPERGRFRCEIPDADNVTQTLYVNICEYSNPSFMPIIVCYNSYCILSTVFFTRISGSYTVSVAISPSGLTTAGETYSLTCSATLNSRNPPLPDPAIPSPTFEWFFGTNGDVPLPSGLTNPATVLNSGTFTSTLQFSPLSQSHTGNYTCRLGAGRLVNSNMLTVNGIALQHCIYTYSNECCHTLYSPSFQHLLSLFRSLLLELQCWNKMTTPSHVLSVKLTISTPL